MAKRFLSLFVAVACAVMLAGCAQNSGSEGVPAQGAESTSQVAGEDVAVESLMSYTVSRVEGEPDWEAIPQLDIDHQQWLEPVDIAAHAQLCYSDDAFYVRMWAEEAEIRAEYPATDLLANTYEDSCLEFFLSPVSGDSRYLNFEFNPNGAVGAQIGTTKTDRTRLVRTDDPYQASAVRTADGWEISYRVPFDFIRSFYPDFTVESGMELRGNFYKCGNLTVQKHYLSWNPIESDTPNFHMPEYFGVLVLE